MPVQNEGSVSSEKVGSIYAEFTPDINNCVYQAVSNVNVNSIPTITVNSATICTGSSTILTASGTGGPGPFSYTWSPTPAFTSTISVNPGGNSSYTVTGEDQNGCVNSAISNVTVNPLPTVLINGVLSGSNKLCNGNSEVLLASGALTYLWSDAFSAASHTVSPSSNTNYTVTGTDANNCTNTAIWTITVPVVSIPSICMVTTDSASLNNEIYWDKTLNLDADSFRIYREVSTGIYSKIGAVHKSALSMFTDINRVVGPANGDPNITTYRYKISVLDTCGNEGPKSPYHTSVYFNDQQTGAFTWNTYSVESTTITPVTTFELLRDSNNTGFWKVIGTSAGTSNILNDPQYVTYQFIANWRVQANGFNCVPTMRLGNNQNQTTIIRAKSNITNNRTSGNSQLAGGSKQLKVYPNPSNGSVTISNTSIINQIIITDVLGNESPLCPSDISPKGEKIVTLDVRALQPGIYFVTVLSGGVKSVSKLLIEK